MPGLRKYPPDITENEWNDLVDFLGGPTQNAQIDTTKILAEGSPNYLFKNKGQSKSLVIGSNDVNLVSPEPDSNYEILTTIVGNAAQVRVTAKTSTKFTVNASAATTIDWVLIR